jgi:hypothetical protein
MKIKTISNIDLFTEYAFYKPDFISAYKNNGHDIELALSQVSVLRDISKDRLRTILKPYLKLLKNIKKLKQV